MRGRVTAITATGGRKRRNSLGSSDAFKKQFEGIEGLDELPAVVALKEGKVGDIKPKDIDQLFSKLSLDKGLLVKYKLVERLLENYLCLSAVERDAFGQHVEVQLGGVIGSQQFYNVLNKSVIRTLIKQAHKDKIARQHAALPTNLVVERSFLQHKVAWRVDRDDAFGTLPMTAIYMLVFMTLVVYHLQIWRRQELERGIESWIEMQGEQYYGPFLREHVYSRDTFKKWLIVSGLPGMLGNTRDSADGVEIRMDNTNIVVGDVYLRQYYGDEYTEKVAWLLFENKLATAYIEKHRGDRTRYIGAASETVNYLFNESNGWLSDETKELSLFFHTYNNQAEMYAKTEIRVRLDQFGHVKPIIKARAVMAFSYPFAVIFVFDALYCLIILRTLWTELKDMCAACVLGFGEFVDYWTVWNAVDWASMTLGVVNIALWVSLCILMQADSLHGHLDGSHKIRLNKIDLSVSEMDQLHSDLDRIYNVFVALHITVAATAIFIVFKFFKGFQANPRLQTVTATLTWVSTDVAHFFVVFMAVFSSFAVIGHVLFGGDITKFYTLASSFNTGITVLMGEFEWYENVSDEHETLPSDMPRFLVVIWFITYMTFVLLIMLNMLLAIILERYSEVSELLSSRSDARTLWEQSIRWTRRKIEMRGFIPLYRIRRLLENDLDPAHPDKVVSESSLIDSFPGMTTSQASWIMKFLEAELKDELLSMQEDEDEARAKRTERFIQSITEELHVVGAVVEDTRERLRELENTFRTTGFRPMLARAGAEAALKEAAGTDGTSETKARSVEAYRESMQISGLEEAEYSHGQAGRWLGLRCSNADGKATCCL